MQQFITWYEFSGQEDGGVGGGEGAGLGRLQWEVRGEGWGVGDRGWGSSGGGFGWVRTGWGVGVGGQGGGWMGGLGFRGVCGLGV